MFLAMFFGLVPNYYLAILVRTLWGFCNGNAAVLKTYISEVCSEDMQSLGFSVLVTVFGIAKYILQFYFICSAVGPSLGGFLGDVETYFPGLVKTFPKLREVFLNFISYCSCLYSFPQPPDLFCL